MIVFGVVAVALGGVTLVTFRPSPQQDIVDGFGIAFGVLALTWGGAIVAFGLSLRAPPMVFDNPLLEFTARDRWALRGAAAAVAGGPLLGFAILLASTTSGPTDVPPTLLEQVGGLFSVGVMLGVPALGIVVIIAVLARSFFRRKQTGTC